MPSEEIQKALEEREIIREFVQHPGAKLLARKLRDTSRAALRKQLDADPYTEADIIKRNQQLRYVLNILLPQIIRGIANYDPETVDKQVSPKKRWSILEWFKP